MEITVTYGAKSLSFNAPANATVDCFMPAVADKLVDLSAFRSALHEGGTDVFLSIDSPLIIVNDGYRHTPTALILEWLEILQPGLIDRAHFLIATGAHSAPTEEHLRAIFGPFGSRIRARLSYHDAGDPISMIRLGVDSMGGEVHINRLVCAYDRILVIGSVEPHYFAGFTGGRKSFFPGLCDLATIERNHNLAVSLDCAPLKLEGNPVAEHLNSLLSLLDLNTIRSIQIVADTRGQIAGIFVGALENSFTNATRLAESVYARAVSQPYDALVCELCPPLDANLYQAQKALENSRAAVLDGGAVIVVSECREGIGSDHFFDQADTWDRKKNLPVDGILRFGSHKLARVNALAARMDVCLHSSLEDAVVRKVFFEPVADLKAFLATKALGRRRFRLGVVYDAGHTVLRHDTPVSFSHNTFSSEEV